MACLPTSPASFPSSLPCLQIAETYQPDQLTAHLHSSLAAVAGGGNRSDSSSSDRGSVGAWLDAPAASGASPWAWEVSGQLLASLAGQAVLYGTALLLVETSVLPRLWRQATAAWGSRNGGGRASRAGYQPLPGQPQPQTLQPDTAAAAAAAVAAEGGEGQAEDPDVEAERLAIQVLPACLLPAHSHLLPSC